MAGKRSSHWTDLDFSDITWGKVFEEAGINKDVAEYHLLMTADAKYLNLRCLLEGEEWAKVYVQRSCSNLSLQRKIFGAVATLRSQVDSKRAKIEQKLMAPSDYAKKTPEYVCDGRTSDLSLHVSLQFKAFGEFLDVVKSGGERVDMDVYYRLAHSLMREMSRTFDMESFRVCAFAEVFFEHLNWNLASASRKRATSDLSLSYSVSDEKYVLVNVEVKNELSTGTGCLNRQNNGYFLNFQVNQVGRSPMLLLSMAGPHYMQVFGAVWNEARVCVDPLSDPVSLLCIPRDPRHAVERVARILAAMDSTVDKLREYYENKNDTSRWGSKGPYPVPGIKNLKSIGDRPWLFEGNRVEDDNTVCVKFVRSRYGDVVHKLLADHDLAPRLYSCSPLPGGWLVVVMEKVEGSNSGRLSRRQVSSLNSALELLDKNCYVHGDLRRQNILAQRGKVHIVDFDWAGKCGEVNYPPELIIGEDGRWHDGVKCGGEIKKEHDEFQVHKLTAC